MNVLLHSFIKVTLLPRDLASSRLANVPKADSALYPGLREVISLSISVWRLSTSLRSSASFSFLEITRKWRC